MDGKTSSPLLAAYFERQSDLRRFFVARLGSPAEADDLVQDLYLKVTAVAVADTIHNPGAYLYRLASNLMLDRIRQRRRAVARDADWRRTHHLSGPGEDIADLPGADVAFAARQKLERVVGALDALPPLTQKVFRLHKFEGLGHAEVAARLEISRSSVEKHMIDALRHLVAKVGR